MESRVASLARWCVVGLVVVLVALSACSDVVTRPVRRPSAAVRDDASNCPSCLTDDEKAAIAAALDELSRMSDPACQLAAQNGMFRLDQGGFSKIDAYPAWAQGPPGSQPVGIYGTSTQGSYGVIGLSPLAFAPGELTNTIAHETAHADMNLGDTKTAEDRGAYDIGAACTGVM